EIRNQLDGRIKNIAFFTPDFNDKEIKPSPLINYTESIIKIGDNIYKLIDTPSFILSPKTEVEKGIKEQAENLLKRDLENSEEEFYSGKTLQLQHFLAISLKLLIFGSPNSGKSTLMNYLLQENRSLATPTAGTTQEPVIKQKLKEKILQIVNLGEKHNKPLIIIINKCDLLKEKKALKEELKSRLKSLGYVPIIYASALKGTGMKSLLKILEKMLEQSQKKLSKKALAELIEKMLLNNPPKYHKGNKLKIYFTKQELGLIQTFLFFVNNPQTVHFSYQRYIANYLRKSLGLEYLPIKVILKKSK
ncbi:13998_t:CDS:2, partial [Funneliformis geosporum]